MSRRTLCEKPFWTDLQETLSASEVSRLFDHLGCYPKDGDRVIDGIDGLLVLRWPTGRGAEESFVEIVYVYLEQLDLLYMLRVLKPGEKISISVDESGSVVATWNQIANLTRLLELVRHVVELIDRFGSN